MSGSHYYHPSTGALIEGGLREARKCAGLPSPTTVLSLIKGEGFLRYLKRQMWEATVTTPRQPRWTDDDYYEACLEYADQHAKAARERGGDLHNLIQRFHMSCVGEATPPVVPKHFIDQYDSYLRWYEQYVDKTLAVEALVIGQGYAGRLDHCALLKDGRVAVCDVKTQDISKKRGKFTFYPDSWALQLGAYAGALQQVQHVDVLVSVAVSSNQPVVLEAKYWEKPPAYYHDLFLGLLKIWCLSNNYWPKPVAQPELVP